MFKSFPGRTKQSKILLGNGEEGEGDILKPFLNIITPGGGDAIIVNILDTQKLRSKETRWLTQGHGSKKGNTGSSQRPSDARAHSLATIPTQMGRWELG